MSAVCQSGVGRLHRLRWRSESALRGLQTQQPERDEFKALIFVCGLRSHRDFEIRTRLLSKLETDAATLTVDTLATEYQRLLNLK